MQLLSQPKTQQLEKRALSPSDALPYLTKTVLPNVNKTMRNLARGDDFMSGLAAPFVNIYGGARKILGRMQQAPALKANPSATRSELMRDPGFARGARNARAGTSLRRQAGIDQILNPNKSLGFRIGRGVGAASVGLPLINLPFSAASYLGASSANPELAKEYAKTRAFERVQDRLNQFSEMPFFDRLQSAWNPEAFTKQITSPGAGDMYQMMESNNFNNPGILKYLAGFNSLLSSPEEVIDQKIRSGVARHLKNKSASEITKQAVNISSLFKKVLQPAYNLGKSVRSLPAGSKLPKSVLNYTGSKGNSYLENLAGQYAVNLGRNPILTPLYTLGAAYMPFGLYGSYHAGKNNAYESAARAAEDVADLGVMSKFNQPGFMGGLGRFGMAIAPGIGSDMILNNLRQSMFPTKQRLY